MTENKLLKKMKYQCPVCKTGVKEPIPVLGCPQDRKTIPGSNQTELLMFAGKKRVVKCNCVGRHMHIWCRSCGVVWVEYDRKN